MSKTTKRSSLSEDQIISKLQRLCDDPTMSTKDFYSPQATDWPGSKMPFVHRHLSYLKSHKLIDPVGYLSNLALIIKKR